MRLNPLSESLPKRVASAVALAAVVSAGCSLILEPSDSQCETVQDCANLGMSNATCTVGVCREATQSDAGSSGPWGCIGNVGWVSPNPSEPLTRVMMFQKLVGRQPMTNLDVLVCPPFDLQCSSPLATATTDEDGLAELPLYRGFDGHVFVPSVPTMPDMLPTLVFFLPPPQESVTEAPATVVLSTFDEISAVASMGGVDLQQGYGQVTFTAFDCEEERAAGVSVSVEPSTGETAPFYVSDNGFPSPAMTATSSTGEGAIINVPPGTITVTASTEEHGVIMRASILVLEDGITGIGIAPGEL